MCPLVWAGLQVLRAARLDQRKSALRLRLASSISLHYLSSTPTRPLSMQRVYPSLPSLSTALAWVSRERYERRKGTGGGASAAQPKEYVLKAALFEEECNKTNLVTAFLKSGGKVEKMTHWQREAYTLPSPSL